MVELDHPFTTGKPIDETWDAILDLERLVPCVGGPGHRADEPRCSQGGDRGEDGCDVDEVHRHRGGDREGRRRSPRGDGGQVEGGRRTGLHATPTSPSRSRTAAGTSTAAQITGKAASMGEGRRQRPRRDDQGLRGQTRHDLMPRKTMRRIREGEVPYDGGTAVQEDAGRPVFRGNGRTITSASSAAPAGSGDGSGAHGAAGPDPLRALPHGERVGRGAGRAQSPAAPPALRRNAAARAALPRSPPRCRRRAEAHAVDIDTLHPLGVRLDQLPDSLVAVERARRSPKAPREDERVPQLSAPARDRRPGTSLGPGAATRRSWQRPTPGMSPSSSITASVSPAASRPTRAGMMRSRCRTSRCGRPRAAQLDSRERVVAAPPTTSTIRSSDGRLDLAQHVAEQRRVAD